MRASFKAVVLVVLSLSWSGVWAAQTDRAATKSIIVHKSDPTESAHTSALLQMRVAFHRFVGAITTPETGDVEANSGRLDEIRSGASAVAASFFHNGFTEIMTSDISAHQSYLNEVMWKELRELLQTHKALLTPEYLRILLAAFEESLGTYMPQMRSDWRVPEMVLVVVTPLAVEGLLRGGVGLIRGGVGLVKRMIPESIGRGCRTIVSRLRPQPPSEGTSPRRIRFPAWMTNLGRRPSHFYRATLVPLSARSTSFIYRHRFWIPSAVSVPLWWTVFRQHRVWAQSVGVTKEIIDYLSDEILQKSR